MGPGCSSIKFGRLLPPLQNVRCDTAVPCLGGTRGLRVGSTVCGGRRQRALRVTSRDRENVFFLYSSPASPGTHSTSSTTADAVAAAVPFRPSVTSFHFIISPIVSQLARARVCVCVQDKYTVIKVSVYLCTHTRARLSYGLCRTLCPVLPSVPRF